LRADNVGHTLAGRPISNWRTMHTPPANYAEAIENYARAAGTLSGRPWRLGPPRKAVLQIRSGKNAEGTALLRQLAEEPSQLKAMRCEGRLSPLHAAFDAGNSDT